MGDNNMNVEVVSLILSLILVALAIGLVFIAIFDTPKKLAVQMNNMNNKSLLAKYIKTQRLLDVTVAIGYFIIGVLLALNLIPREYALMYILLITLFEKIFGYRLKKNTKQNNNQKDSKEHKSNNTFNSL